MILVQKFLKSAHTMGLQKVHEKMCIMKKKLGMDLKIFVYQNIHL